jgi:hypothetical protein
MQRKVITKTINCATDPSFFESFSCNLTSQKIFDVKRRLSNPANKYQGWKHVTLLLRLQPLHPDLVEHAKDHSIRRSCSAYLDE